MLRMTIKKKKKSNAEYWIMCAIPLLLVFVFNYLPMIGAIIAFKDYRFNKGIFGSDWVGFKNFELFLTTNEFLKVTYNTLFLNALFIIFGVISAVALAILLFNLKKRTAVKIYQTILITPHFMSWVIVSFMVYTVLSPNGILNSLLQAVGMNSIEWYAEPKIWPLILIITFIWKNVGMDCVIYYAALMGIDSSLFEAADIDGASKWQKIKAIIIPELVPIITMLTILKIGGIFRADFGMFYNVPRNVGLLYETTDVVDTYIYRSMKSVRNLGIPAAAGLLQSVVGCAMVIITNKIVKKVSPENTWF